MRYELHHWVRGRDDARFIHKQHSQASRKLPKRVPSVFHTAFGFVSCRYMRPEYYKFKTSGPGFRVTCGTESVQKLSLWLANLQKKLK